MSRRFNVEIAGSWADIAPRWRKLQQTGVSTPFQNAAWLEAWYGAFGDTPGIEPVVVAVTDARTGEDLLLVPLIRRTAGSMRSIEFADLWTTDYNAPLIGAGAPTTAEDCQALWEAVREALPEADIVRFRKMPLVVRGRPNPLARLKGARRSDVRGHAVNLPARWEDYYQSLKKEVRKVFRRRWRRFQEHENAELRWVETADEARRVLAVLRAQQSSRLERLGAGHVFDEAPYVRFYERFVVDGVSDGSAVLTALTVNGEIVATFLAVADRYSCALIRLSQLWDEEWASLGLGKLIIERTMLLLHERGYRHFDLSIGNFRYKHSFGVETVPLCDYQLARTWRAVPALYRDRTWAVLKKSPRMANFIRSAKQLVLRPAPTRKSA